MLSESENTIAENWKFPKIWATFLLLLLAFTAPLWFSGDQTLLVPMLGSGDSMPVWAPPAISVSLCGAAVAVILLRTTGRRLWWLIAALLAVLFVLDQHRMQPWAYQTAIYATAFASMKPLAARRWLVPMATSIYVYSSLGKFDYQFVHTIGVDFLETLTLPIGGLPDDLEISARTKIALLFPATELAIGILLIPGITRPAAGGAAMLMHASLIGILGPWGLNHSAGVLIWNLLLIVQAWFLFVRPGNTSEREDPEHEPGRPPRYRGATLARVLIVSAIVMPILERRGYWDHWPSWALYSPHNSRLDVQIHRSGIELLTADVSRFVQPDSDGDGWHSLSLDRWSLQTRNVPIYPQARYQLGLAVTLAESRQIDDQIRGRLRGVAERRSGKRTEKLLLGRTELRQATKQYWLLPRFSNQ